MTDEYLQPTWSSNDICRERKNGDRDSWRKKISESENSELDVEVLTNPKSFARKSERGTVEA